MPQIDFSPQQAAALETIKHWLTNPRGNQIFRLFGYAGTGKTTLAKEIDKLAGNRVLFAAFTGKAASVMRQKGCTAAQTIHSLIYTVKLPPKEPPEFILNRSSSLRHARLLIIDECSMVGEGMGRDLLSFKTPILVLGDPAQLPPIESAGFFTQQTPDVLLTEVHRQAKQNPIISMSMDVRIGLGFFQGIYGDSRVISKKSLTPDDLLNADQIIVGLNKTRQSINGYIRRRKHLPENTPTTGDKLICLKNDYTVGVYNGTMWEVVIAYLNSSKRTYELLLSSADENRPEINVKVRQEFFEGAEQSLTWKDKKKTQEFTFGYAITCHKAQGSQWDNGLIIDESSHFREDKVRWQYTALTRCAKTATIGV